MTAILGYAWHEASRGEYLAQYFLTSLGVSAPVIRQEDIGIDFYCSLAVEENKRLTFHSPYMVQHGASGSKKFIYGGFNEKDEWRQDGIDWLFSQELPLFVCLTDRDKARCRLYSTSAMWPLYYQFGDRMTQVELCPDAHHNLLEESRGAQIGKKPADGDGYSYRIPLGNPIVDLTVFDFEKEKRAAAVEALKIAVRVETRNLTLRNLGLHWGDWFKSIVPNNAESLRSWVGSLFWSTTPGQNVSRQVEALRDVAVPLALNYSAQGAVDKLDHLAPVFRLIPRETIADWIFALLPKIVTDNLG